MGTPHQYWLAKSFLLLSDIYVINKDSFQAKANLQSVIDNYDNANDGIIEEAKLKLSLIVAKENEPFVDRNKEAVVPMASDTISHESIDVIPANDTTIQNDLNNEE